MNNLEKNALSEALRRRVKEHLCNHLIKEGLDDYEMAANDTHFAIYKPQNKIVFSWDYSDVDPEDLRQFKRDYFTTDIIDNDLNPKDIKILNRANCVRIGLDPSKQENWTNGPSDKRWNQSNETNA